MKYRRPHPVGRMLFEAEEVTTGENTEYKSNVVLLCDFLSSDKGTVPGSMKERQVAMKDFVVATGLEVRVKTFVPIQYWRLKMKAFDYRTDGLVFVPAARASYKTELKLKWKV